MIIRPATINDVPDLARVHIDSWQATYGKLVPEYSLQRFSYQRREECFRTSLTTGKEETFLVQMEQRIVGFLTLGAARDTDLDVSCTGEIWGIYISPDYWRRGIGKKLTEEAETIFKNRKFNRIVLWVLESNQPARRFYEALGYSPDGETKYIDRGTPLKAIRYAKNLESVV